MIPAERDGSADSPTPGDEPRPAETPASDTPEGARLDEAIHAVEHQLSLLWRRGRAVSLRLSRQVHPDMDPSAYGLLSILRRQGPIRLTELAGLIGVGKPTVSRQITFLMQLGLVSKDADPLDGRAQLLHLTEHGEETMARVQDARREIFRQRLGEWDTPALDALAENLERLNTIYERDGL
ncbi:MarR family winged helix-turn-helix transcriptional regulator [Arthrobacter woluwensis]|jgi:DNA-binding MarR family transcriptional regulator|uniref:MarR family winged helix-turn-helix transcriptional regulator n=1 Tax=Arthrobacter woluwensis TaxID=156980 RepID=UPI001AB00A35|nr:MarR family transcriptional regulator [Arthrobacter woluwensis]QTF71045.1 MarR family transcriptional regulator [Arthrobacter woluwensis]